MENRYDIILGMYAEGAEEVVTSVKRVMSSVDEFYRRVKRFSATLRDFWAEGINKSIDDMSRKLRGLHAEMRKITSEAVKQMGVGGYKKTPFGFSREQAEDIYRVQKRQEVFWKSYFKNSDLMSNKQKFITSLYDKWREGINKSIKSMGNMEKQVKRIKHQFAGWAMSIMFFGMALRRAFDKIWAAGTSKFQDVMHSVEGTVTGFDRLNASTDILKFELGAALEPVIRWLIPIIDAVSTWIANHQSLARWITITAGVLGTMFSVGGGLVLAFNGFAEAMGLASISAETLGGAIAALSSSTAIVGGILGILGLAAYKADLGGMKEYIKTIFDGIKKITSGVFNGIKKIVKGVWDFLIGLFSDDDNMMKRGLAEAFNGLLDIADTFRTTLAFIISNTFVWLLNSIIDLVKSVGGVLSRFFSRYNPLLRLYLKIRGINYDMYAAEQIAWSKEQLDRLKLGYSSFSDVGSFLNKFSNLQSHKIDLSQFETGGQTIIINNYSAAPTLLEEISGYNGFSAMR